MPHYRRRNPSETAINVGVDLPNTLAREAITLTRRLLPFPGTGGDSSDALTNTLASISETVAVPGVASALQSTISQQANVLVPRAAAILDEEMVRGVVAAKDAPRAPGTASYADPLPLLEDLYKFAQRFATVMPSGRDGSASSGKESTPVLSAPGGVAPGQSVTLSMQLDNEEGHALHLTPRATDLLSNRGGQIPAGSVEFCQREVHLQTGERKMLKATVRVPSGTAAGYYTGLLVIAGADNLRALMCIDVSAK